MKLSNLVGERFKEKPSDCQFESHSLMVRGGYIKMVCNGIYSLYTPAKRIMQKIENIIREEMNKIDGQEVSLPVVLPATLWKESNRFETVGEELLRFKDRADTDMVLAMTHEEAAVHLVRDNAKSYTKYPFMIYQIQTKFRDEPRARGGLIRVREFTMKDAYSFHTSKEDLENYYNKCYKAYEKIFKRCGIGNVVVVKSDSGMMGGSVSHEYMLLTDIGEDTIAICSECDYKANMEAAECIVENKNSEISNLEKVYTKDCKTIEDVCNYLNKPENESCKAVVYQENKTDKYIVAFVRGDLEVNETKLRNYLKSEIHPAQITDSESGLIPGFIGPYNLNCDCKIVIDKSLKGINSLVCGANEVDYHFTGFNFERDYPNVEYIDIAKTYSGAVCPACGHKSITIKRGIEVGNIFQLGTKYTQTMNMQYIDKDGKSKYPLMGCYGIGVGRLCASVCEVSHDDYGPIWPITIAPWQVHICALRADDENVKSTADNLYESLTELGVDVIYDDRKVSAGSMFSDADLLGVPIRVIVSPKNLKDNVVEISLRDKSLCEKIETSKAQDFILNLIKDLTNKINK